jgi:hypothetical protein
MGLYLGIFFEKYPPFSLHIRLVLHVAQHKTYMVNKSDVYMYGISEIVSNSCRQLIHSPNERWHALSFNTETDDVIPLFQLFRKLHRGVESVSRLVEGNNFEIPSPTLRQTIVSNT